MSRLQFKLEKIARHSRARAGRFRAIHGEVLTPIFMPVGTQATVKSQTVETLKATGSNVLLANTYHLLLRPGPEVFKKFGGINRFMNWDRPVLTDSGGFQIFSLPHSRQMNEEGARFQSYVDGKMILLSPELSIETQKAIGSDIMMVLDQCIPSTATFDEAKAAMELTHRWAIRSLNARQDSPQSMFGIVQGACFPDLRKKSAEFLTALPFDGFAIGGLAVGEGKDARETFTALSADLLPSHLPRYLMGVGTPIDILEAVHRGVDMFDCILPSQLAQRGVAFTSLGKFQLRRSVYKLSEERLDPACSCETCATYSRAYLHHLVKSDEVLGWHLIAKHNIHFYHQLMREIRESILEDRFLEYYEQKRLKLIQVDEENPSTPFIPAKVSKAEKRKKLGDYEVHLSEKGFASIKQVSSGEIMHSVNPPEEEARHLYLNPSRIQERLEHQDEIVIWDVGLGAATNAMAVIHSLTELQPSKKVRIESFEIDLDPLRLALKHPHHFSYLKHAAPHALIRDGLWKNASGNLEWKLHEGDFFETLRSASPPDLIFFDPFSSKVDSKLWMKACFARIREQAGDKPFMLMTYSVSTLVRALFLEQGFYVGRGAPSGPKAETTLVFSQEPGPEYQSSLLGAEWMIRWERSGAKAPSGLSASELQEFESRIRSHPQFSKSN